MASGQQGPGLPPQPAWGASARLDEFVSLPETARGGRKKVVSSEGDVAKPVDGAVCGSWSPLQPSAT